MLASRRFFLYPLALSVAIRLIGAVWFYHDMTPGSGFHFAWMESNLTLIPAVFKWLFLFNAGDSFMFPIIAMSGYTYGRYPWLPGYPIVIRLIGALVGDYWFGAFLVTQAFALGSIVVFQLLAEEYMKPDEAMHATLLLAAFPYIFVFTVLGYSEAMFFFCTIAAWYFYRKERLGVSSLLVGAAAITRIYGIGIILPMILDNVSKREPRRLLYSAIPLAFVGSWMLFCYFTTGDPIVSWTAEQSVYSPVGGGYSLVHIIWGQLTMGMPVGGLDPAVLIAFALLVLLSVKVWKVDRLLWVYTMAMFATFALVVTSHVSMLRYMAFVFPIWLTLKVRNPVIVAVCVGSFVAVSLLLWLYVITVFFVG